MDVTLLKKLVSFDSSAVNEDKIGRFLASYLSRLGFKMFRQPVSQGRFNILASRGSGRHSLMFYGHLDTTATKTLPGWKSPPLELTPKRDRLYGLGAYDMKGGIFAFLSAVSEAPAYTKIFLAVDEENISSGAWMAVQKTPSFFTDVSLIVSAEPNFGYGANSVTIGRTGRFVFQLVFTGLSAHIARYQAGLDAIDLSARFVTQFYRRRTTCFSSPHTIAQVRKISGESIGMSVCDRVTLEVEILPGPLDSVGNCLTLLRDMSHARVSLKPRSPPYLPAHSFDSFPYQAEIHTTIRKHLGRPMTLITRSSVGDDNVLATLKIPVITWGPSGDHAHNANEYVSQRSLAVFIAMYSDLLRAHLLLE